MAISSRDQKVLKRLARHGSVTHVAHLIEKRHPADIAAAMTGLRPAEARTVARALVAAGLGAVTLAELPDGLLETTLAALSDQELAKVVGVQAEEPSDGAALLSTLPEERRAAVLALLTPKQRAALDLALKYPPGSAGAEMTTRILAAPERTSVEDAVAEVRRQGTDLEAFFYMYVVDVEGRLTGVVSLKDLILSAPDERIGELMVRDPIKALASTPKGEVADVVARYDFLSLPVVDDDGRLLGAVTVDNVIDAIHEEATGELYGMAGLQKEDGVFSPVLGSARRRLGWTLLNLGTALVASLVVGLFEVSIAHMAVLATLMPIVAGLGGNSGTQSLTITVRALALGELDPKRGLRAIARQLAVGLTVGAVAGLVSSAAVLLWRGDPMLGLVIFLAMTANMAVGALVGAGVPVLLRLFRQDPALGSGVLVTGITDSFGFFAFLGLGTLLLLR